MRSLHEIRRDWLSDEELWLAIPEGEFKDIVSPTSQGTLGS